MQIGISKNNAQINAFESDINYSLHDMSSSLNHKFKITQEFDNRVVERMDFLRDSLNSKELTRQKD